VWSGSRNIHVHLWKSCRTDQPYSLPSCTHTHTHTHTEKDLLVVWLSLCCSSSLGRFIYNYVVIEMDVNKSLVSAQNLDALHDHLATIYPGMRAPSFRCTVRPEDGALILHYYSDRPGLEYIVIGIVKVNVTKLHYKYWVNQYMI